MRDTPAEHEVGLPDQDRVGDQRQVAGVSDASASMKHTISLVAMDDHVAGGAESALGHPDHGRPVVGGDVRRGVGGAVVGHDRMEGQQHPGEHPRERLGFIQARQNDIDYHAKRRSPRTALIDPYRPVTDRPGRIAGGQAGAVFGWLHANTGGGTAEFIRSTSSMPCGRHGHEVQGLDSLAPAVHDGPPGYLPAGFDLTVGDIRDPGVVGRAVAGADAVCHQAAMVGLGVNLADLPAYADVNVTGTAVLLEAMGRSGIPRLVLASSMVVYGEGAYDCRQHGRVRPAPRGPDDLSAGQFEPRCPDCGQELTTATVAESAPLDPPQRLCRQQGRPGAPGGHLGADDRRVGGRAALSQRLRPEDAAGHAVLRRRRDLPVGAGERPGARGLRGWRAAPRLRPRP